jgi:hypothetical protein
MRPFMNFKELIELAWSATIKNIVSLLILTVVFLGVSVLTMGILAPVAMAGYTQSILLMVRSGKEPKPRDVFSHMRLFFPLLGFGILAFIAVAIGYLFFVIPGILITIALMFYCIYMLPLMTDKELGIVDAIKESFAMVKQEDIVDHVVVVVLYSAVQMIGSTIVIGSLFTMPIATVFLMLVYERNKIRF